MPCKPLKGVLRSDRRLVGKLASSRVLGPDGLYFDGSFEEVAQGYYVSNVKTNIPDGCYRNGGLVDPYYEAIIQAAQAEGGGLYLFQLEHGSYAGEQVIWQEMGELTPWEPGLLTPQGKTYDLMGSGEYLGQSVSMRRPVDGVWDGVGTWLDASSKVVGNKLHQSTESAWFAGLEMLTTTTNANLLSTSGAASAPTAEGVECRWRNEGVLYYRRSGGDGVGTLSGGGVGLSVGNNIVVGASYGSRAKLYANGVTTVDSAAASSYPDTVSDYVLRVGARASNNDLFIHARYTYIAIYTREPTAYEISLHKRTP